MAQTQWDQTLRTAKSLESRLDATIQKYASITQKYKTDSLYDEENATLLESKEELELSSMIEIDLKKLNEAVDTLRTIRNTNKGNQSQESLIKRYHDVHQEYLNEYRNTSGSVRQKRESSSLFSGSRRSGGRGSDGGNGQDSLMAKLLREKSSLSSSLQSINDVISQAFEAKNSLLSQRVTLQGSATGITGLVSTVPSFKRLIDGVQRKKTRETMIVAALMGTLLCFTIWWLFLR